LRHPDGSTDTGRYWQREANLRAKEGKQDFFHTPSTCSAAPRLEKCTQANIAALAPLTGIEQHELGNMTAIALLRA
jgi:hypothetical protein